MLFALHDYLDRIILSKLSPSEFRQHYLIIQECILLSHKYGYLFHLIISPDEISIFYNMDIQKYLDVEIPFHTYTESYRCMELHCLYIPVEEHGIDHIGIVSTITGVLSKHNISILYVNSYNHNFVLVREDQYERSRNILLDEGLIES